MSPLSLLLALSGLVATSAAAVNAADHPPTFRIAGYLPDYRAEEFDPDAARGLTDLILFSAEATAAGDLDLTRLKGLPWEKLRTWKTRQGVRLILCVGGWERSAGFAVVAASQDKRRAFARAAVRVCLERRLDGIDIDWEHPQDKTEQASYGRLLSALKEAFRPHGLMLSVTLAAWQELPQEAFAAVDWVQVMSYDHEGRHSTQQAAEADVRSLLERGVPAGKVVLGLPFYGRHVERRDETKTYRELTAQGELAADVDELAGVYFNGPATIRAKTEFALRSQLAGVMVWELGQDARGDKSLLRTIRETVERKAE